MKAKHLWLEIAALVAAGGLWLAWSAWRSDQSASLKSGTGVASKAHGGANLHPNSPASLPSASESGAAPGPNNGEVINPHARLAAPIPNRRFTDFTPEQRVQFARQGHGPGG